VITHYPHIIDDLHRDFLGYAGTNVVNIGDFEKTGFVLMIVRI
jgi:hypothetical protein